jgi:hypothetical protein
MVKAEEEGEKAGVDLFVYICRGERERKRKKKV